MTLNLLRTYAENIFHSVFDSKNLAVKFLALIKTMARNLPVRKKLILNSKDLEAKVVKVMLRLKTVSYRNDISTVC